MKVAKTFVLICSILWAAFGWPADQAQAQGVDPVTKQAKHILELIERNEWQQAIEPTEKLKQLYLKNKWKYQFLGDEEEYEQLNREIAKLRVAIKEQDTLESKIIIASILSIIHDIYSL